MWSKLDFISLVVMLILAIHSTLQNQNICTVIVGWWPQCSTIIIMFWHHFIVLSQAVMWKPLPNQGRLVFIVSSSSWTGIPLDGELRHSRGEGGDTAGHKTLRKPQVISLSAPPSGRGPRITSVPSDYHNDRVHTLVCTSTGPPSL